jgi:glyoxylase-like metal-dependent hydrolase (beta-lactamase superfamily II)
MRGWTRASRRTCRDHSLALPRRGRQHGGDAERFQPLVDDVSDRIFDTLPDETWFYPGHGNDSTLGAERFHLEEWRERGW